MIFEKYDLGRIRKQNLYAFIKSTPNYDFDQHDDLGIILRRSLCVFTKSYTNYEFEPKLRFGQNPEATHVCFHQKC